MLDVGWMEIGLSVQPSWTARFELLNCFTWGQSIVESIWTFWLVKFSIQSRLCAYVNELSYVWIFLNIRLFDIFWLILFYRNPIFLNSFRSRYIVRHVVSLEPSDGQWHCTYWPCHPACCEAFNMLQLSLWAKPYCSSWLVVTHAIRCLYFTRLLEMSQSIDCNNKDNVCRITNNLFLLQG